MHDASIIALIANPEKYDGKPVRVIGFLRLGFEGTAIYLHQSDYENRISKNGLWITGDIRRKELDQKYVLLEGTFKANDHGHLGMWSGTITDIKRMEPWPAVPSKPAAE